MKQITSRLAYVHPVLFAALPVLALLSHNINEAPILHAVRPVALALVATGFLLPLVAIVFQDWEQASLLTSFALMMFFSYGHVYFGLVTAEAKTLFQALGLSGNHSKLAALWLVTFAVGAFAIHRIRGLRSELTQIFALMGVIAILSPVGRIVSHEIQLGRSWSSYSDIPEPTVASTGPKPDIFYIVLDGYARSDVLQEIFNYDNSDFERFLVEQGFYIARQGRSNYTQTGVSIASSLNMMYLDGLLEDLEDSEDRTPIARLVRWSRARAFLEQQGYSIHGISSGYRITSLENSDHYYREPIGASTTLDRLLIETSGLILLQDLAMKAEVSFEFPGYAAHRDRIDFALRTLESLPAYPGPKFVFTHLLIPHPPFVFLASGEAAETKHPFTLMDGDAYLGSAAEYIEGYRQQIAYVDRTLEHLISKIIDQSEEPPIILLQADHGSGLGLDWDSAENSDLWERTSILNAYFLPGIPAERLYPHITPVNSFRLIFDSYFNTNLGLLEDASYYSTWQRPYDFITVSP